MIKVYIVSSIEWTYALHNALLIKVLCSSPILSALFRNSELNLHASEVFCFLIIDPEKDHLRLEDVCS